mmetsp:Transcript_125404/g.287255  ORF Transcript_125404/g.287255 Transcript_125404/m.287255 type:complete len:192 (+) Transcript_125404:19-594(+)
MGAQASADAFRAQLTRADVRSVVLARNLFHASTFVPLALYHLKLSDDCPKFPATISYSIRKGVPRVAHHVLWLMGWAVMIKLFRKRGDRWARYFAAQMISTGILAVIVCPLGQSAFRNKVHFFRIRGIHARPHHFIPVSEHTASFPGWVLRWICSSGSSIATPGEEGSCVGNPFRRPLAGQRRACCTSASS